MKFRSRSLRRLGHMEPFCFFFFFFGLFPGYFRCLEECGNPAVKLQKCLADYETSPDFPSAWWWGDNDRSYLLFNSQYHDISAFCNSTTQKSRNNTVNAQLWLSTSCSSVCTQLGVTTPSLLLNSAEVSLYSTTLLMCHQCDTSVLHSSLARPHEP